MLALGILSHWQVGIFDWNGFCQLQGAGDSAKGHIFLLSFFKQHPPEYHWEARIITVRFIASKEKLLWGVVGILDRQRNKPSPVLWMMEDRRQTFVSLGTCQVSGYRDSRAVIQPLESVGHLWLECQLPGISFFLSFLVLDFGSFIFLVYLRPFLLWSLQ